MADNYERVVAGIEIADAAFARYVAGDISAGQAAQAIKIVTTERLGIPLFELRKLAPAPEQFGSQHDAYERALVDLIDAHELRGQALSDSDEEALGRSTKLLEEARAMILQFATELPTC